MGFCRVRRSAFFVLPAYFSHSESCDKIKGQVWFPHSRWNERAHSVAGFDQHRHGDRSASGGGDYAAFRKLRGVLAHNPVPGNWFDRKCKHASLRVPNALMAPEYVLKITSIKSMIICDNSCFSLANIGDLCY